METYDNTRFTWIEKLESPRESELSNSLAIANFKTNMVCKNESTIPQICIKSILFLDAIRSVLRNKGFPHMIFVTDVLPCPFYLDLWREKQIIWICKIMLDNHVKIKGRNILLSLIKKWWMV